MSSSDAMLRVFTLGLLVLSWVSLNCMSQSVHMINGETYFNNVKLGPGYHSISIAQKDGQQFYQVVTRLPDKDPKVTFIPTSFGTSNFNSIITVNDLSVSTQQLPNLSQAMSSINIPAIKLPDLKMPDIAIPNIPDIKMPTMPVINFPIIKPFSWINY